MNEEENKKQTPGDEEEENKLISAKKVVYCEIDDEVTAVYDRIRQVKAKNVYIVIPRRAVFFQSIVNLKILKKKAEAEDKKIFFITNDPNGIYLAKQIGITVYDKAAEGKPSLFSTETEDEQLRITPLKASVNAVEEESPMRLTEKKISISELLKLGRGNKKNVVIAKISKEKGIKENKAKSRLVLIAPNRHALISLVVVSVVILLVIVYIALPGATLYLTPSASVLEQSLNITLADYQKNRGELELHPPHILASYPIETTVTKTLTHNVTGKKFSERGANASGQITIVNLTNAEWPLIAETRFQTEEGIVFRIKDGLTVPAASTGGPGKTEAFVSADPTDAFGAIVGERGNIGPGRFFLPGLKESSRSDLYAENSTDMTGGITDYVTYVTAEDLEAAKFRIKDELLKSAVAELENAVDQQTELANAGTVTYSLLEGEGAVKTSEPKIEISGVSEGQEISEFTVTGELTVTGVYYDHALMLEILKSALLTKKSPQKELLRINEQSTSYRIFEWDENSGRIKLTVNIKGIEQYEIDPEKENGARLLKKIKDHIKGKDVEEAKLYIQNLPEINKVEIESWPMWSPTIPNLTDNIEFEIREAITVE